MSGSRTFRQGRGWGWVGEVLTTHFFFSHQRISQTVYIQISPKKHLDPRDPIASRGVSVPIFLREPIATCDFPGSRVEGIRPFGSTHDVGIQLLNEIFSCVT